MLAPRAPYPPLDTPMAQPDEMVRRVGVDALFNKRLAGCEADLYLLWCQDQHTLHNRLSYVQLRFLITKNNTLRALNRASN